MRKSELIRAKISNHENYFTRAPCPSELNVRINPESPYRCQRNLRSFSKMNRGPGIPWIRSCEHVFELSMLFFPLVLKIFKILHNTSSVKNVDKD